MRTALKRIEDEKAELRGKATEYRNGLIVTIFRGMLDGSGEREIRKAINAYSLKRMPKELDLKGMDRKAKSIGIKALRKAKHRLKAGLLPAIAPKDAAPAEAFAMIAFDELAMEKNLKALNKERTKALNAFEGERKQKIIEESNRNADAFPFIIVSSHGDCAEDHLEWQGRLYVKAGAREDPEVDELCRRRNIHEWAWVIGKPVWLVTRPNCRHYFDEVSLKEAKEKTERQILEARNMVSAQGRRKDLQTIYHPTARGWYTRPNVKSILREYESRKWLHEQMLMADPGNRAIKAAIAKDGLLVRRWQDYLWEMDGRRSGLPPFPGLA